MKVHARGCNPPAHRLRDDHASEAFDVRVVKPIFGAQPPQQTVAPRLDRSRRPSVWFVKRVLFGLLVFPRICKSQSLAKTTPERQTDELARLPRTCIVTMSDIRQSTKHLHNSVPGRWQGVRGGIWSQDRTPCGSEKVRVVGMLPTERRPDGSDQQGGWHRGGGSTARSHPWPPLLRRRCSTRSPRASARAPRAHAGACAARWLGARAHNGRVSGGSMRPLLNGCTHTNL